MKTAKFDLINAVNAGGKDLLLTIDARIASGSLVFERQYTDSTGETIDVYKSAVGGTCKAEVRIGARIDDEGDTVKTVCLYYRGRVYTSYPIFCGKAQNADTTQAEVIETAAAEASETREEYVSTLPAPAPNQRINGIFDGLKAAQEATCGVLPML